MLWGLLDGGVMPEPHTGVQCADVASALHRDSVDRVSRTKAAAVGIGRAPPSAAGTHSRRLQQAGGNVDSAPLLSLMSDSNKCWL